MVKIIFTFLIVSVFTINTQAQENASTDEEKVFSRVEQEAIFPGGDNAWHKFIGDNIDSDVPVNNNAPVGKYKVVIRFIVDKIGKVTDVVAETNYGYGMETEAIRIIKMSPDWKPAMQNARPVNAIRRQPFIFIVEKPKRKSRRQREL